MRFLITAVLLASTASLTCAAERIPPLPETVAAEEFDHGHRLFDEVLRATVKGDRIDYRAVDREKLGEYVEALEGVTPETLESWTENQRYAFWINVYNAHVIQLIVDNYPTDSIKDLGGALFGKVWDKEFIRMTALHPKGASDRLSLDDVEHQILRPRFQDARVHAAVNCASISCPPLRGEAFVADRLDEQLDAQMKAFVNDPLRNELDEEQGVARVSAIFDWFEGDFERDAGSVREYLIRFAPEKKAFLEKAKIRHLDYDWDLNDVER